jgi:hypothetical protein
MVGADTPIITRKNVANESDLKGTNAISQDSLV